MVEDMQERKYTKELNELYEKQHRTIDKNLEEIHLEDFKKMVEGMSEEEKIVVLKSIKKTEVIICEVLDRVNRLEDRDEAIQKLFGVPGV